MQIKEKNTLCLQAKELQLEARDYSTKQLMGTLCVKKKQDTIVSLLDNQGNKDVSLDIMASMMLNHLS